MSKRKMTAQTAGRLRFLSRSTAGVLLISGAVLLGTNCGAKSKVITVGTLLQ